MMKKNSNKRPAPVLLSTCLVLLLSACVVAQAPLYQEDSQFIGGGLNSRAGSAVAEILDFDGDSLPEVLVGAPGANSNTGQVTLFSPATRISLGVFSGINIGDRFGSSVSAIADRDGDGLEDVLVGAPGGRFAQILSSATGVPLVTASSLSLGFGFSVDRCGDTNGDGIEDFVVGASSGNAEIRSGATGATLVVLLTAQAARAVCGISDVDGDGIPDVVVGMPTTAVSGMANRGLTRVLSGSTGTIISSAFGLVANDFFGASVDSAGDLNGDGQADYVVGAPQGLSGPGVGFVQIVDGATGAIIRTLTGMGDADGKFGATVRVCGDTNGNGFSDVAVGAPEGDTLGRAALNEADPDSGYVSVFFGGPVGPGTTANTSYSGLSQERFGTGIAAADFDGDGNRDLSVGAPMSGFNASNGTLLRLGTLYTFSVPNRVAFVSFKRVFGRNGMSAPASPWTQTQITAMIGRANAILAANDAHLTLQQTSVTDIYDPGVPLTTSGGFRRTSWFNLDLAQLSSPVPTVGQTTTAGQMEAWAQGAPSRSGWVPNAINVYLINEFVNSTGAPTGQGGESSFPYSVVSQLAENNEIIFIRPRRLFEGASDGDTLAHELGHYFNLVHTHHITEPPPSQCASLPAGSTNGSPTPFTWATGDCSWDTLDDTNPGPSPINFGAHDTNFTSSLPFGTLPQYTAAVLSNLMSFHTPPAPPATPSLTFHQKQKLLVAMHNLRRYVLLNGQVNPVLTSVTATSPVYAGNAAPTQRITFNGSNLPITTQNCPPLGGVGSPFPLFQFPRLGIGEIIDTNSFCINQGGAGSPSSFTAEFSQPGNGPLSPGRHDATIWEVSLSRNPRVSASLNQALTIRPAIDLTQNPTAGTVTWNFFSAVPNATMALIIGSPAIPSVTDPQAEGHIWIDFGAPTSVPFSLTTDAQGQATLATNWNAVAPGALLWVQALEFGPTPRFSNPYLLVAP